MEKIPGATTSSDLTKEMVEAWYGILLESNPEQLNTHLTEIMRKITHVPDPSDPSGAVIDYVSEVVTKIRQMWMGSAFTDERQSRQVVTKMINGLKPQQLKERIIRERVMWAKNDDGRIPYFSRRAEDLARKVHASEAHKPSTQNTGNTNNETRPGRSNNRRGRVGAHSRGYNRTSDADNNPRGTKRRGTGNREWTRKCLNKEKCDGVHRIEDCPVTSESDKRRLLREHIESLKKAYGSNHGHSEKRQRRLGRSLISSQCNHDIDVVIGGVEVKARDETGADMTVIPMKLLTQMLSHNENLVCLLYTSPSPRDQRGSRMPSSA